MRVERDGDVDHADECILIFKKLIDITFNIRNFKTKNNNQKMTSFFIQSSCFSSTQKNSIRRIRSVYMFV
jgi:hypothetical protein